MNQVFDGSDDRKEEELCIGPARQLGDHWWEGRLIINTPAFKREIKNVGLRHYVEIACWVVKK